MDIKVVPYGSGWEDVYMTIEGEELHFVRSEVMGETLNELMEVLYYLYPQNDDHVYGVNLGDRFESVKETVDAKGSIFSDIIYKGSFAWCSEPDYDRFTIERPCNREKDFNITICLKRDAEEGKEHVFQVDYRDFCYALAKGITEALEEHGLRGYYDSTWTELNLKYFLFIKGVALDCVEELRSREEDGTRGSKSNFRKELALMMQRME